MQARGLLLRAVCPWTLRPYCPDGPPLGVDVSDGLGDLTGVTNPGPVGAAEEIWDPLSSHYHQSFCVSLCFASVSPSVKWDGDAYLPGELFVGVRRCGPNWCLRPLYPRRGSGFFMLMIWRDGLSECVCGLPGAPPQTVPRTSPCACAQVFKHYRADVCI